MSLTKRDKEEIAKICTTIFESFALKMECIREGCGKLDNKLCEINIKETNLYEAGYNKGLKDAYERILIKLEIIDNPNKIIKLYPKDKEEQ